MNQQQKEIAEKIISAMKEEGGLVYQLDSLIRSGNEDRITIIRGLEDLGLIEDIHERSSTYWLTEKGWKFKNFIEYEKAKEHDDP